MAIIVVAYFRGDGMDKENYKLLDVLEQIAYVNGLLIKKQSLTKITKDLDVARSTLGRNFKKADYVYDSTNKQFVISTLAQETKKGYSTNTGKKIIDYVVVDKLANQPVRRPKFSIPIKTKLKTTKAFNVVMNKDLVERIDKLCKAKGGYSRNELVNKMCEYAIDNMDEK